MFTKITKETLIYIASIIVVLGLLLLIPQLRIEQGLPAAFLQETYASLNEAAQPQTFFHYGLARILASPLNSLLLTLLPLLLALGSLTLLFSHVTYKQEQASLSFLTGVLVALTPAFLAAHLSISFSSILLFCILLTTYLYRRGTRWYLLTLPFLYLFDPITGVVLSLILAWHSYARTKSFPYLHSILSLLLLIAAVFMPVTLYATQSTAFITSANQVFSFFGAISGYTLTLLLLGVTGLAFLFYQKKQSLFTWISIIGVVFAAFYTPLRLVGIVLLATYSAQTFFMLVNRKFSNKELGQYILLLFVCIFFFSSVTFIKDALTAEPTVEQVEVYSWLERAPISGGFLIHPSQTEYTRYFSGREFYEASDSELLELFETRDSQEFIDFLQAQNISFIVVEPNLRAYLQKDNDGILFILKNNDAFQVVYTTTNMQVYYFVQ